MTIQLPKLKAGDRIYLVNDNGIEKKKEEKSLFFWKRFINTKEDTYVEIRIKIESVSDDDNSWSTSSIYIDRQGKPTSYIQHNGYLTKETIQNWINDNNCGVVIKRVRDIIFEHKIELIATRNYKDEHTYR